MTYKLRLPNHYRISPTFHVSLLKPFTNPLLPPSTEPEIPSPPEVDTNETIYRLPTAGWPSPIPRGLGGIRSRGEIMGGQRWHPGSITPHRLPSSPPRSTGSQGRGRPPSVAGARSRPWGRGYCHWLTDHTIHIHQITITRLLITTTCIHFPVLI